jgi:ABC-type transport system involved in cytochrome c biogenesis ATPase subunit
MRSVDFLVESELRSTARVKQLSGMFDVPPRDKLRHEWHGELPIDERPWQVGLIVGPSGAGKSTLLRQLFGAPASMTWDAGSVVDDFDKSYSIDDIAAICQAVGFNSIPSWMKPYAVLSTGERFRVEMARQLLEGGDLIVVDEFTSVVDRQVAQIGAHAVQRHVRKTPGRQLVAATCHYDVIDWLQPDWMLEPATMTFQWRSLRRRPDIAVEVSRVDKSAWRLFAPFHYLTSDLHKGAACFVLFVNGVPASFAGVLHRPHPKVDDIKGLTRGVTLPDFQGLGLVFALIDTLGAAYGALGNRLHLYPAHPAFIRAADRSPHWAMHKKPGKYSAMLGRTSTLAGMKSSHFTKDGQRWNMGSRPCAVFEYVGPKDASIDDARALIEGKRHVEQSTAA